MDTAVMMLLTVAILPIIGACMALTPYLMKKGECFTVTVPSAAAADPYLRALKRRYLGLVVSATLALTTVALGCIAANNAAAAVSTMAVGTLLICGFGYSLMLYFRRKTAVYKREQGWEAAAQEAVAQVGEGSVPRAISLKWNVLYLPILALTLLVGLAGYADMPDQIVLQVGFGGEVSRWAEKSPVIVLMPTAIQAFIAISLVFSHWSITRSKKLSEPGAPATSALAYGLFARAQSVYLLVIGVALNSVILAMPLSFMGALTLTQAGILVMVAALVAAVGAIAIGIIYGQGGARVFARMQGSSALLADNDGFWKLGVFYFNPEDPSLFLPARFGIGWTANWARPGVWAIVVAGLAVTAAFVAVTLALF